MVNEAEKYKDEDDKQRERITAKNSLESFTLKMKSTMEDDTMKSKMSEQQYEQIISKCKEVIDWADKHQAAEKEEYISQQKDLERICANIAMLNFSNIETRYT